MSRRLLCRACRSADADARATSLFYRDVRFGAGGYARRSHAWRRCATAISPACRRPSSSPRNATRCPPTARPIATASSPPAGGRWWREEPGLVHSFLRARTQSRRAARELRAHRRRRRRARQRRVAVLTCSLARNAAQNCGTNTAAELASGATGHDRPRQGGIHDQDDADRPAPASDGRSRRDGLPEGPHEPARILRHHGGARRQRRRRPGARRPDRSTARR